MESSRLDPLLGEEAGVVIHGTLDLWVGDTLFHLQESDSFAFDSTTPLRFRNPTQQETL